MEETSQTTQGSQITPGQTPPPANFPPNPPQSSSFFKLNKPALIGLGAIILLIAFASYFVISSNQKATTPQQTAPSPTPSPSVTSGEDGTPTATWKTYANDKFLFSIKYPSQYGIEENGKNSFIISKLPKEPGPGPSEFIYISIIQEGFISKGGEIYNYNTTETNKLLAMQVEETEAIRFENELEAVYFTYTRLPDIVVDGTTAKLFENKTPWQLPTERRLYIHRDSNMYMIGTYYAGGDVSLSFFDQILSTFTFSK